MLVRIQCSIQGREKRPRRSSIENDSQITWKQLICVQLDVRHEEAEGIWMTPRFLALAFMWIQVSFPEKRVVEMVTMLERSGMYPCSDIQKADESANLQLKGRTEPETDLGIISNKVWLSALAETGISLVNFKNISIPRSHFERLYLGLATVFFFPPEILTSIQNWGP